MPQVVVKAYGRLRELFQQSELNIVVEDKEASIRSLINTLIDKYGEEVKTDLLNKKTGGLTPFIIVNGETAGLDAKLKDKDVVAILPPAVGG